MPYLQETELETAARNARIQLGILDQPLVDVMTLITKMKRLKWIKNYERKPDNQMMDDEAAFDPASQILLIKESVFCAANGGDPRARMTIAHEIGHIFLRHKKLRYRNVSNRSIEKIAPTIRQDEYQAKRFAGAFLVPPHLTTNDMSVTQLVQKFGISTPAAEVRKQELEKMHRQEHAIKRPLPQWLTDFLKERGRDIS